MHNLLEYFDNSEESSGSLWQYKKDEQNMNNAGNPDNVNANDSSPFKYKSNLLKGLTTRDIAANVNPDIANVHRLFIDCS